MPERLECEVLQKERYRYINPLTFILTFTPNSPLVKLLMFVNCANYASARGVMFSTGPFIRYHQSCEHVILQTEEMVLLQIGVSGSWHNGMKRSTLGVKRSKWSQGHMWQKLDLEALGSSSFSSFTSYFHLCRYT